MRRNSLDILRATAGEFIEPDFSYNSVIWAMGIHVVRLQNGQIELSEDEGSTFTKRLPPPTGVLEDEIRLFHVFTNGRALCASHTNAYYTEDWTVWLPSNVLAQDGSPWQRALANDNFTAFNQTRRFEFAGQESLMFSNYNNNENANGMTVAGIGYVWFTQDYGATLRVAFQLGQTVCSNTGLPLTARHIHSVSQDPYTGLVYFDTGDEPRNINSHWGRGTFSAGAFTWEDLGTGTLRKTVGIHYDAQYIYGVLDTENGGLIRYVRGQEDNTSNAVQLLTTINDCAGAVFGASGSCCVHQLTWNANDVGYVLWYSRDKISWTRIVVAPEDLPAGWGPDTVFVHSGQPTNSGKALIMVQINGKTLWPAFKFSPSAWLDEILLKYGFPNAFN